MDINDIALGRKELILNLLKKYSLKVTVQNGLDEIHSLTFPEPRGELDMQVKVVYRFLLDNFYIIHTPMKHYFSADGMKFSFVKEHGEAIQKTEQIKFVKVEKAEIKDINQQKIKLDRLRNWIALGGLVVTIIFGLWAKEVFWAKPNPVGSKSNDSISYLPDTAENRNPTQNIPPDSIRKGPAKW